MTRTYDVAVIGGGSAGSMAYLRSVLNFDDTVWFLGEASEKKKSRGTWVFKVDNIPGMHDDPKPIAGAAKATKKWVEAHDDLKDKSTTFASQVVGIENDGTVFRLTASKKGKQESVLARYVILATGVMDVQPLIGGSIEPVFPYANRGDLIYCVRCDGHHVIGKPTAVIGSESTGVAVATLMFERYGVKDIRVLTHGQGATVGPAGPKGSGIEVLTSPITEIHGEPKTTGMSGFTLEDGTAVAAEKAIVALGTIVYNELAVALGADVTVEGRVVTDAHGETSVPGLFAAGDLVANKKMQIYTGWDEAVDAADMINRRLRAERREAS